MTKPRFALAGALAVLTLGVVMMPTRAQQSPRTAPRGVSAGIFRETEEDFSLWKRKAELELEILQAQIEAKQAEIKRAEAEFRIRQMAPTHAILAHLAKPIPIHFPHETPLEDVLKSIKAATAGPDDHGIPIYVDPVGLQEAEKTMLSPVTLDLEGVPLRTSLRLLLKQLGLVYTVHDGLLTITSEESVDRPVAEGQSR
jgi:hypothetical protein